jgi:DNA-binding CsgD family transcriptional regulator
MCIGVSRLRRNVKRACYGRCVADDVLDVLESAYRLDGDDDSWLDRVARAAQRHIDPRRHGMISFFYQLGSDGKVAPGKVLSYDVPEPYAAIGGQIPLALPPWYVRETFAQHPCGSAMNTGSKRAREMARTQMKEAFAAIGWRDLLVVNGLDPTGRGVYIAAARRTATPLPRALQTRWTRVAVHLAAAWRLRRALRGAHAQDLDGAEAILSPTGKIEHASEHARTRQARQALSHAAHTIERGRTPRGRRNGDRTVAEWTGLIAARWSLVDHFESDGKRFLVARRNDVADTGRAELSPRELQAVAFAALGHNNKLIAYEMGIAAETVRVLLHRAARKLGAHDRSELIERARLTFTPTL